DSAPDQARHVVPVFLTHSPRSEPPVFISRNRMPPSGWELPVSVSTVLLLLLTTIIAVSDLVTHKIHNRATYTGIVLALIVNSLERGWDGPRGLEDSLKGLGLCGGLMLVSYVLFHVGGGDVKLLAMIGAFLGVEEGIEALLWTFVLGGIAGLTLLIWRVGFVKLMTGTFRHLLWSLKIGDWLPLTEEERRDLQRPLYLAPAAVVAVVIVVFDLMRLF
ncbi:MAG TPA: A24 family peptidase, partial [Planctomycetaceae bacterium]|nr:A24 family peptidase [Planctomycetaceae bacterium]